MPSISAVDSVSSHQMTIGKPGGALGKDEFLKLLTTQMSSQDPLEPMDNTAMIAQLAQFSALEQMQNVNTQLGDFRREVSMGLGMSLSGQDVMATFNDGSTVQGPLNAVSWRNNNMTMDIGEEQYQVSDLMGLRRAPQAQP